jgi:hypothetical protein
MLLLLAHAVRRPQRRPAENFVAVSRGSPGCSGSVLLLRAYRTQKQPNEPEEQT